MFGIYDVVILAIRAMQAVGWEWTCLLFEPWGLSQFFARTLEFEFC